MGLENYQLQFKISKEDLPKLKDEALQIEAVKNLILKGTATISLLEQTEEFFTFPNDAANYPGWNSKMDTDLLIEFEPLLTDEQAKDGVYLRNMAVSAIGKSNVFQYIYEDEKGRHIAFAVLDVSETNSTMSDKEWEKQQKDDKIEQKKLANLFSKKGKSK